MGTGKSKFKNLSGFRSIFVFVVLSFTLLPNMYGIIKETDLYRFEISRSEIIDSLVINNKKVKVQMVSESSITPDKTAFKYSSLTEILKAIFVIPDKYIRVKDDQLYDFSLTLKQKNVNTDTIRRIFILNMLESLYLHVNLNFENKEVLDLFVLDSAKFKILATKKTPIKTCINRIAYRLDCRYNDVYITGNDTSSMNLISINEIIMFSKLEEKLKNEYGLGFRKINKKIRFIDVD